MKTLINHQKRETNNSSSAIKHAPVIKSDFRPIKIVPPDRNLKTNTKIVEVNGNTYTFINTYKESEIVFTHYSVLHIGTRTYSFHVYYDYGKHEPNDFKPAMRGALNKYRKEIEKQLKKDFLESKGYQRLAYNVKSDFESLLAKNTQWQELNTVLDELEKA